jgi:hypothetical protein
MGGAEGREGLCGGLRWDAKGIPPYGLLKAELKRAGIGYKELADRLNQHGMEETESGIASKLSRGTFDVAFFLACLAVLELDGVELADL